MKSKKQLVDDYGINLKTVRRTLEACGLDLQKETYSEEEIHEYFQVARTMIDSGSTYAQVAAHFGVEEPTESPTAAAPAVDIDARLAELLRKKQTEQVEGLFRAATESAVREVLPHVPQMFFDSVEKLIESGEFDAVFSSTKELLATSHLYSSEASYEGETIDVGLPTASDKEEDEDDPEQQWEEFP